MASASLSDSGFSASSDDDSNLDSSYTDLDDDNQSVILRQNSQNGGSGACTNPQNQTTKSRERVSLTPTTRSRRAVNSNKIKRHTESSQEAADNHARDLDLHGNNNVNATSTRNDSKCEHSESVQDARNSASNENPRKRPLQQTNTHNDESDVTPPFKKQKKERVFQQQFKRLRDCMVEIETEGARYEAENTALRDKIKEMEEKNNSCKRELGELQILHCLQGNRLAALQREQIEQQEAHQHCAEIKQKYEAESASLKEEIKQIKQELHSERTQREQANKQYEADLESKQQRIESLQQECKQKECDKVKIQQEYDRAREDIEEDRDLYEQTKISFRSYRERTEEELNRLRVESQEKEHEIEAMKKKLSESAQTVSMIHDLSRQCDNDPL